MAMSDDEKERRRQLRERTRLEREEARNLARAQHKTRSAAARSMHREQKKLTAEERELARRILAQRSLCMFTLRFQASYQAGWVHQDICKRLEKFSHDVIARKSPRLMLFMPPRHGKSTIVSKNFPAWHLGHRPEHEIIITSYAASLATKFSKQVRELVRNPAYEAVFKTRIDPENQGAEMWMTTKGGGLLAAGVGGPLTGNGAHILVIDDPVKNREEAESMTSRQSVKDWYTSTAYTRLAPGGGVLICQTRWHDDDLSGWLLEEAKNGGDEFEVVVYPAIATQDEYQLPNGKVVTFPMAGAKKLRARGEALHSDRYDVKALKQIERAVGPRDWAALYQQTPVPDTGNYFDKGYFRFYEGAAPGPLNIYAAWD